MLNKLILSFLFPFNLLCYSLCNAEPLNLQITDLSKWNEIKFPSIKNYTEYSVLTLNNEEVLQLKSNSSSSLLISNETIDLNENDFLTWSWNVVAPLPKIDPTKMDGDDYAIRIYLMTAPKKSTFSWFKRQMSIEESPGPTIGYVWRENGDPLPKRCFQSPYSPLVKLIGVTHKRDKWENEKVNPLNDFKECFGVLPIKPYRLGVMADSDNSQSASLGFLKSFTKVGGISKELSARDP